MRAAPVHGATMRTLVPYVNTAETAPHRMPNSRNSGSSYSDRSSYSGTRKAGAAPRPACVALASRLSNLH